MSESPGENKTLSVVRAIRDSYIIWCSLPLFLFTIYLQLHNMIRWAWIDDHMAIIEVLVLLDACLTLWQYWERYQAKKETFYKVGMILIATPLACTVFLSVAATSARQLVPFALLSFVLLAAAVGLLAYYKLAERAHAPQKAPVVENEATQEQKTT